MSTSIHHRMPLTSDYISDNPERDVTSIAVEVGGVVHLGHYSTRNGMIRVTYGSSCKPTQLGGIRRRGGQLACRHHVFRVGAERSFCVGLSRANRDRKRRIDRKSVV